MSEYAFSIDYAKRVANCKKCKEKITKGEMRIARHASNPFSDDGIMKQYHHPACIFDTFKRARATTKIIEDPCDIEGWGEIKPEDRKPVLELIRIQGESPKKDAAPKTDRKAPAKGPAKQGSAKRNVGGAGGNRNVKNKPNNADATEMSVKNMPEKPRVKINPDHKDNSFKEYRKLCSKLSENPSSLAKTEIMERFFKKGTENSFQGDLLLWIRLLLPGVVKRIYNMQNKQIIKIFSRLFGAREDDMLTDLEEGDVAATVGKFFESSKKVEPLSSSCISLYDVDDYLAELSLLTKEDEQQELLARVVNATTTSDLVMFVRLIKGDLRINAGAKPVLDSLHPDAYQTFNTSRNLPQVVERVLELRKEGNPKGSLGIGASLMQPIQPMLAQPCKSVEQAFQKCPNGIYSEIKYDGERVQLHMKGSQFKYFSRSLKPVMPHKVKHFAEYMPKAFPDGADLILDAEVLLIDNVTGKPLPFGSLGIHKGSDFQNANPCLFIFDCIYYNGKSLIDKPLVERRKLLENNMKEVGNWIKFSEIKHITKKSQLLEMIEDAFKQGLEGLVLKDLKSVYEPGKRHWLKVKKDYLNDGAMADTADLVVLGGWYGSGQKGGLVSTFLMGCHDTRINNWRTVTKVFTGHDDATLEALQGQLLPLMVKIKGDPTKVPSWLRANRNMVPDFIMKDPWKSVVWEITGAEFTKAEIHTANGISIRFPRVTKIRDDKSPDSATNLQELENLYKTSKETADFNIEGGDAIEMSPKKKTPTKRKSDEPASPGLFKKSREATVEDVGKDSPFIFDRLEDDGIPPEAMNISSEAGWLKTLGGFSLRVVQGDLFTTDASVSLCHCVSRDMKLGKGIAKIFRDKFGRIKELEAQHAKVGEMAVLKDGSRFIYNLVTKEKYHEKPTYNQLRLSLEAMRNHARRYGVKAIAMPKIGCGLDGLQWAAVRTLLKVTFRKDDIAITVFQLEPINERDNMSPTMFEAKPPDVVRHAPHAGSSLPSTRMTPSTSNREPAAGRMKDVGFGYRTRNPLIDLLSGMTIYLPSACPERVTLQQFIVGFDGRCLGDREVDFVSPTHVIYEPGEREVKKKIGSKGPRDPEPYHLRLSWLTETIRQRKLQPYESYIVTQGA